MLGGDWVNVNVGRVKGRGRWKRVCTVHTLFFSHCWGVGSEWEWVPDGIEGNVGLAGDLLEGGWFEGRWESRDEGTGHGTKC